jgi:hypothetical protein
VQQHCLRQTRQLPSPDGKKKKIRLMPEKKKIRLAADQAASLACREKKKIRLMPAPVLVA